MVFKIFNSILVWHANFPVSNCAFTSNVQFKCHCYRFVSVDTVTNHKLATLVNDKLGTENSNVDVLYRLDRPVPGCSWYYPTTPAVSVDRVLKCLYCNMTPSCPWAWPCGLPSETSQATEEPGLDWVNGSCMTQQKTPSVIQLCGIF